MKDLNFSMKKEKLQENMVIIKNYRVTVYIIVKKKFKKLFIKIII